MPRYRVTELAYINDRIVNPDEEVDFEGIPSEHMILVDEREAPKVKARSEKSLREEAKKIGAKLLISEPGAKTEVWRDLTDDDSPEIVAKAIADTKQLKLT